jgi:hypothetical protein
MLNVMARLLERYIFTATPPPLAQTGLDDILSELLEQDEKKERLCRAMLMSVSTEQSQDKLHKVLLEWILEFSGFILPAKSRSGLKSDFRELMKEASNFWTTSRLNRKKIIATLDYESYTGSWKDLPVPSHKNQENKENSEASDPEDQDEVSFIAFPAIVAVTSDEHETIFPGYLIRFSQVRSAEIEWRKDLKKRRFSYAGVPRAIPGLPDPFELRMMDIIPQEQVSESGA